MKSSQKTSLLEVPEGRRSFYKPAAPTMLSCCVVIGLLFFAPKLSAQMISISVNDPHRGLLTIDSSNWNEAWIEMDGSSPTVKKLGIEDITVSDGEHFAEVLSVDSVASTRRSHIALSFVLDNSGSMFHAYDSLTRNCDSIIHALPPGAIGQGLTFDNRARRVSNLYTKEHSIFIAQQSFTDSMVLLSKFWHYYDTIRTQFTPLYDAIFAAARNITDRKAKDTSAKSDVLIVVTDGDDNASRASIELLEEYLASAHLRLFAINFRTESDNRLDWLARKTGGEFYVCDNTAELRMLLHQIGLTLTQGYHIKYRFHSLRPSGSRK
jgi:hypothetical protein